MGGSTSQGKENLGFLPVFQLFFQPSEMKKERTGQFRPFFPLMGTCRKSLIFLLALFFLSTVLQAQEKSGFNDPLFQGSLFGGAANLFPKDDRIKVLVIALKPYGLTESAAEQIGLIVQKNLNNTGHFSVVGPREMTKAFERDNPDLVDCREIACGVEGGKSMGADRVLAGTIRLKGQRFVLDVRLIDTFNNNTDYEEQVHFNDETMDERLFRLVNNISRNQLRTGRVLSTSVKGIVVSLGRKHGIKIGDFLVVYKKDVPIADLEGRQVDLQKKNIAVVKVLNVNENSSEAILTHYTEEPQVSHYAGTYLDQARQVRLVENTRKELDTGLRLENKIRPSAIAPVLLADNERKRWQDKFDSAESTKNMWLGGVAAGGMVTLSLLSSYQSNQLFYSLSAIGGTGYAIWQIMNLRAEINDFRIEGRAKGFSFQNLEVTPHSLSISLAYRF